MIKICCENIYTKKIDVIFDGKKHVLKCKNNIAEIELPSKPGKNHFVVAQHSIFNTKYWWVILNPFFWLLYGGMLLNYYLGYNGNFAQLEFDVIIDKEDENIQIDLELKKHIIPKSEMFSSEKAYLEFDTNAKEVINRNIPRANKAYVAKWRSVFLIVLYLAFLYLSFVYDFNSIPWDIGIICVLFLVTIFFIYRIIIIFSVKDKIDELEKIKRKI